MQFITDTGGIKIAQALNFHTTTGELTVPQRKLIVHSAVDYMVHKYGYYPKKDIKIDIAKVMVSLFPCMGKKQGDNIIVSAIILMPSIQFQASRTDFISMSIYFVLAIGIFVCGKNGLVGEFIEGTS